jgi:hypothetical protein
LLITQRIRQREHTRPKNQRKNPTKNQTKNHTKRSALADRTKIIALANLARTCVHMHALSLLPFSSSLFAQSPAPQGHSTMQVQCCHGTFTVGKRHGVASKRQAGGLPETGGRQCVLGLVCTRVVVKLQECKTPVLAGELFAHQQLHEFQSCTPFRVHTLCE